MRDRSVSLAASLVRRCERAFEDDRRQRGTHRPVMLVNLLNLRRFELAVRCPTLPCPRRTGLPDRRECAETIPVLTSAEPLTIVAAVPEPGTLLLLGLGIATIAARSRRRGD